MFEDDHMLKTELVLGMVFMFGFLLGVLFKGGWKMRLWNDNEYVTSHTDDLLNNLDANIEVLKNDV